MKKNLSPLGVIWLDQIKLFRALKIERDPHFQSSSLFTLPRVSILCSTAPVRITAIWQIHSLLLKNVLKQGIVNLGSMKESVNHQNYILIFKHIFYFWGEEDLLSCV